MMMMMNRTSPFVRKRKKKKQASKQTKNQSIKVKMTRGIHVDVESTRVCNKVFGLNMEQMLADSILK